eukprot:TRINITY_DN30595_c0_g1_i1.p1 TRINITY_DN30595_c0_g1~~TRINITY_DN30595_c0_g1_i1.p1  ORF type:complete len:308 (+),score=25.63 TRINITY_DN30595_c0_g1_i1:39-926(+)
MDSGAKPDIAYDLQKLFQNVILEGGIDDGSNDVGAVETAVAAALAVLEVSCVTLKSDYEMMLETMAEGIELEAELRVMRAKVALTNQCSLLENLLRPAKPSTTPFDEQISLISYPDIDIRSHPMRGLEIGEQLEYNIRDAIRGGLTQNDVRRIQDYARHHKEHFFWVHEAWKNVLVKCETDLDRKACWYLFGAIVGLKEYSYPFIRGVWEMRLPQLVEKYMNFNGYAERPKYIRLVQQWYNNKLASPEVIGDLYVRAVKASRAVGDEIHIPALAHLIPGLYRDRKRPREDDIDGF